MSELKVITAFACSHVGVSRTTPVYVRKHGSLFEARCGIAIMGAQNMTNSQLKKVNPFQAEFHDNMAIGTGASEEEALANLSKDMGSVADTLF